MYGTLTYFTLCTMHFALCTMHLTRCTSLDVFHDALHSVYYALDTLHFNRCINAVYLILRVLDPMYFSEGLRTEEPFAMLSGTATLKDNAHHNGNTMHSPAENPNRQTCGPKGSRALPAQRKKGHGNDRVQAASQSTGSRQQWYNWHLRASPIAPTMSARTKSENKLHEHVAIQASASESEVV